MKIRTVLDGNAIYEIDEECLEKNKKEAAEKAKASGVASAGNRAGEKIQRGKSGNKLF